MGGEPVTIGHAVLIAVREVNEEGDGGEVVRAVPSFFLEEVTEAEVVLNGPVEGHCV